MSLWPWLLAVVRIHQARKIMRDILEGLRLETFKCPKQGQTLCCRLCRDIPEAFPAREPLAGAPGKEPVSGADVRAALFVRIPYLYTARFGRVWKQLDIFVL